MPIDPRTQTAGHLSVIDDIDVLSKLLQFSWKGQPLPLVAMEFELRHDLAQHKYVGRDGALVENTGRAPIQFSATIPFRLGLVQGPRDGWTHPLYPTEWRRFMESAAESTAGILVHPELGPFTCKLESAKSPFDADRRDGMDVMATWIETIENGDDLTKNLAAPSPISAASTATQNLDAIQGADPSQVPTIYAQNLNNLPSATVAQLPVYPQYKTTFSDLMRSVQAVSDQATIAVSRAGSPLAQLDYRARAISDSVKRFDNSLNWQAQRNAQLLLAAVYDLKTALLVSRRRIGLYPVPAASTLAMIAQTLNAKIAEVMALNPTLVRAPIVPKDSIVRYYSSVP